VKFPNKNMKDFRKFKIKFCDRLYILDEYWIRFCKRMGLISKACTMIKCNYTVMNNYIYLLFIYSYTSTVWAGTIPSTSSSPLMMAGKPKWKKSSGKLRHRWEDNITMYLKHIDWEDVEQIYLALVNMVMNLRIP